MSRKVLLSVLTALFIVGMGVGAQAQTPSDPASLPAMDQGAAVVAPSEGDDTTSAVLVGNKICPVSGEKIGDGMKAATFLYKGKIYNFCCAACIEEFKKDPEKYIAKVEAELKAEAPAQE